MALEKRKKQRFCRGGCEGTAPALLLPMLHADPLPLLSPWCCTASRGGCTDPVSTKATENTLQMPLSTHLCLSSDLQLCPSMLLSVSCFFLN